MRRRRATKHEKIRLWTLDSGLRTQDSGLSSLSENMKNTFCHCERSEAISLINNQL